MRLNTIKKLSLYVMALFYFVAGLGHFFRPEMYMRMMPPALPYPLALIYLSGVAESVLGASLLVSRFRKLAAWGIIALLVAVFPANIYMYHLGGDAFGIPQWVLLARLPFQLVFILWAYWYTRPMTSK